MNLADQFIQHIQSFSAVRPEKKQLVAVSGGMDSIVLCDLLNKAGYDFVIAHCNFQLRDEESERDEKFVRQLGEKYEKQVLVKKFETAAFAEKNKKSIQLAARELRYNWFNELLEGDKELQFLLTAHHANDNIETLLMNFFKGTGMAGLHGILPLQGKIFRPLLFAKKQDLLRYCNENKLGFVEDSSNLSDKYTRNYFRQHLMPLLQEIYPNVEDNLLNNIERFTEAEQLYKDGLNAQLKKLVEAKGNEIHIPVLKLKKANPLTTILYEVLKDYGFTPNQIPDVQNLLDSETGKYVSSATHRILKNRNWLIIAPLETEEAAHILIENIPAKVKFANGELSFKIAPIKSNSAIEKNNEIATLDASKISLPLILRKWKTGDYFYPLGLNKKKKINRFLSDLKLSPTAKEKVWVLEMDKKIVWVVGHRIDDRFKVLAGTKEALIIS